MKYLSKSCSKKGSISAVVPAGSSAQLRLVVKGFDTEGFEFQNQVIENIGTDLPPVIFNASRIYAKQITLSKSMQVEFSVYNDHGTMGFSFVLRVGACHSKGLIGQREFDNIERVGMSTEGIVDQFLQLILGLNLQERLLKELK